MSGALRTVATVAGAVALVSTGLGALGGLGAFTLSPSAAGVVATVSKAATVAAAATSIGAQLTAKKPPAKGSQTATTIGADQATCCMIGRTYNAGARMHDVAWGGEVDKVQNPYRALVDVYSVGPIDGFEALQTDFITVNFVNGEATGWFDNFLYADKQIGATPEPDALISPFGAVPRWSAAHRISGLAAVMWSARFDKDARRFASGYPATGVIARGVRCYDPRRDSTYPGGVGQHRLADPATWEFSECPGLNGLRYVLGTFQNGRRVFGIGLEPDMFLVADFVELANICDARGWTVGGNIYEPGNRWNNLKDILAAGGAEPCFKSARLGVRVNAPRVAVDTLTRDDLAAGDIEVAGMLPWRDRLNTLVPKYRSESHKWEYVPGDPVVVGDYREADGEEKKQTRQINLCQDVTQAAQLVALELLNSREKGPIDFTAKSRFRRYPAGVKIIVDLPEAGLDAQPCILLKRTLDAASMTVPMQLIGETEGKYPLVAAVTGVAPPPIYITPPEDLDNASGGGAAPAPAATRLTVDGESGQAEVNWNAPSAAGWDHMRLRMGATDNIGSSTIAQDELSAGLNATLSVTVSGLAPGTYFFWVQTISDAGAVLSTIGPEMDAVT